MPVFPSSYQTIMVDPSDSCGSKIPPGLFRMGESDPLEEAFVKTKFRGCYVKIPTGLFKHTPV